MTVLSVQITSTANVPNVSGMGLGMTQELPVEIYVMTNDTLATVLTAGYLNESHTYFQYPYNNYQMALVYTTDAGPTWLRVSVTSSGGTYTYSLITPTEGSGSFANLLLGNGTAAAPSLAFTSDVGTGLYRVSSHVLGFAINGAEAASLSASTFDMLGNIAAGISGTAGTVSSFPATASKGSLILTAVANTGNTTTTISNAAMGQASVVSIPDPGAATANFLLNSGRNTMAAGSSIVLSKANGVEAANAVTASGNAGVITTSSLNTAGGASYAITWTNTFISATSVVLLSIMGGTNSTQNITLTATAGNGTSTLTIYNNTAATALNGTIFIGYTVL